MAAEWVFGHYRSEWCMKQWPTFRLICCCCAVRMRNLASACEKWLQCAWYDCIQLCHDWKEEERKERARGTVHWKEHSASDVIMWNRLPQAKQFIQLHSDLNWLSIFLARHTPHTSHRFFVLLFFSSHDRFLLFFHFCVRACAASAVCSYT